LQAWVIACKIIDSSSSMNRLIARRASNGWVEKRLGKTGSHQAI